MLRFYFQRVLPQVARLSPPAAYLPLALSGHWFRDWRNYCSGLDNPRALQEALVVVEEILACSPSMARTVIREYLRFESRFVLENFWILSGEAEKVRRAFQADDVARLAVSLPPRPGVVVTAHTAGLYSLVELLRVEGTAAGFVLMNTARRLPAEAEPIQLGVIELLPVWARRQQLIFTEDGRSLEVSRENLAQGRSVIIAPDVPGYVERGVVVEMFGRSLWTAVGAAKLARDAGAPLTVVVPVAADCRRPYTLFVRQIDTSGSLQAIMARVYAAFSAAILPFPACWSGWLFWRQMAATAGQ